MSMKSIQIPETTYVKLAALAKTLDISRVDDLVNIICVEVLNHAARPETSEEKRRDSVIDQEAIKKQLLP